MDWLAAHALGVLWIAAGGAAFVSIFSARTLNRRISYVAFSVAFLVGGVEKLVALPWDTAVTWATGLLLVVAVGFMWRARAE